MSSRVALVATAAVVAAPILYAVISGKSLKQVLIEISGSKSEDEIQVVPGSMAVTAAELEGSSPEISLGTPKGNSQFRNETMSLFARRQSSKKLLTGGSPAKSLDVSKLDMNEAAVPGSMAITAAQVDGQSPSLNLPRDDKDSLLARRVPSGDKAEGTSESTPAEDHALQMTITAQQLDGDGKPVTPTMELGLDTGRRTSLFNRRQSARDIQVNTITAASVHGSSANTVQLGGERSSPSSGRASLFARRSMKKMNPLEGTAEAPKEKESGTTSDPPRDPLPSGGEEGGVGRQVSFAAVNVQLGWARCELEAVRGRWREAKDKLEAREADYEAMDQSTPQGAVKIRNWHKKEVDSARAAAQALGAELAQKQAAVAAAEAKTAKLQA